jgi:malate dehydrogenase
MAEAITRDTKSLISCCAYCKDEYNAGGYFVGVPVILGKDGVEKVIELKLNSAERAEFDKSLEHVRQLSAQVDRLL